jgi:alkanesulfonate monooxygenase SsuD/methylene tetrahydromethanopterin reductase-like flavin-dependent oxidoreductase (luciferase family)
MHIGLEADAYPASAERYLEIIDEAVLADEAGFDFYGLSEGHFKPTGTSSPEVLFGAMAVRTKRIKLRFLIRLLLAFNHPIRVAEQVATLDLISGGRAELGTGRSNHLPTLEGFGIDPRDTRAQWAESLEVIAAALTSETFEHHGRFWDIPPRTLTPQPLTKPHPPILMAATSVESARLAGEKGIGVMIGNSLPGGWAYVEECIGVYKDALTGAQPASGSVYDWVSVVSLKSYCAETSELAKEEGAEAAFKVVETVAEMYRKLAPTSPDYAHLGEIVKIAGEERDLDHLIERAPYISIGDPAFFVDRCARLEAMGVDEIILDLEGFTHEQQARAIDLMGREVVPLIKHEVADTLS